MTGSGGKGASERWCILLHRLSLERRHIIGENWSHALIERQGSLGHVVCAWETAAHQHSAIWQHMLEGSEVASYGNLMLINVLAMEGAQRLGNRQPDLDPGYHLW